MEDADSAHTLCVTDSDGDLYVTVNHPMTKNHYLSFLAYVTSDRVELLKLYPEGRPMGVSKEGDMGFCTVIAISMGCTV